MRTTSLGTSSPVNKLHQTARSLTAVGLEENAGLTRYPHQPHHASFVSAAEALRSDYAR